LAALHSGIYFTEKVGPELYERSWLKYLAWALNLAELTGSYVILFPISFHINRSPATWKDPRTMIHLLKDRHS
jgi:hypothetical protein